MHKLCCGLLSFLCLFGFLSAMTFPIDLENCQIKRGRVVLTGWYLEKRAYGKHRALDIPANIGTPIKSVVSGIVIEKGFEYRNGRAKQCYGNYVVIQDVTGRRWYYAHLNTYNVKLNELIAEGQTIATVGYTGLDSPRAHLHIECRDMNNRKISFSKELGRAIKPFIPDQKSKYAFALRR